MAVFGFCMSTTILTSSTVFGFGTAKSEDTQGHASNTGSIMSNFSNSSILDSIFFKYEKVPVVNVVTQTLQCYQYFGFPSPEVTYEKSFKIVLTFFESFGMWISFTWCIFKTPNFVAVDRPSNHPLDLPLETKNFAICLLFPTDTAEKMILIILMDFSNYKHKNEQ